MAEAPALAAVRESLPWSLAGLLAGLLFFFVFVPVRAHGFAGVVERVSLAELPAFGLMAIVLVLVLSCRLAVRLELTPPIAVGASVAVFALALPRPASAGALGYLHQLGTSGLFLAIVSALAVAAACAGARRLLAPPLAADAFAAASAVALAAALFYAHVSVGGALATALQPMARLGDTYTALIAITIVETLLWLAGIHGPAMLAAIVTPVYLTLQLQNTAALAHHEPLPHVVVISLFLFVFPGGAGATLPLAALLAASRVARLRRIGRLTLLPAVFNVNEPLIFGLPVAFNPALAIPFVAAPLVLATITYLAVVHGFVGRPAFYVPSSVPSIASAYLSTLDLRAIGLMVVNVAIATLIYLPFVRAYERREA